MTFQDLLNTFRINPYLSNENVYQKLLEKVRDNLITPVIGAGLSVWAGYPLWARLLSEKAKGLPNEKEILRLLRLEEYERAATILENTCGHTSFQNILRDEFSPKKCQEDERPKYQQKIPSLFRRTIVTTNYDVCLEKLMSLTCSFTPENEHDKQELHSRIQNGERVLVKLHGTIDNPEHIILTEDRYNKAYGSDRTHPDLARPLPDALKTIFQVSPPLFLGCGLGPDRTCAVFASCLGNTGYALLELPAETENKANPFDPILREGDDFTAKFKERKEHLENLGIQTIWYPYGHHEAVQVLIDQLYEDVYGDDSLNPDEDKTYEESDAFYDPGYSREINSFFDEKYQGIIRTSLFFIFAGFTALFFFGYLYMIFISDESNMVGNIYKLTSGRDGIGWICFCVFILIYAFHFKKMKLVFSGSIISFAICGIVACTNLFLCEMPDVKGKTYIDAETILQKMESEIKIYADTPLGDEPSGWWVVDQNPEAGNICRNNVAITLTVQNEEPKAIKEPDLEHTAAVPELKTQLTNSLSNPEDITIIRRDGYWRIDTGDKKTYYVTDDLPKIQEKPVDITIPILKHHYTSIFTSPFESYDMNIHIYWIQSQLWELGYYRGELSGLFDNATNNAIQKFMSDNGYIYTNRIDQTVVNVIFVKVGENRKEVLYGGYYHYLDCLMKDHLQTEDMDIIWSAQFCDEEGYIIDFYDEDTPRSELNRVHWIQFALKKLGYSFTDPDEMFGKGTDAAVQWFESRNNFIIKPADHIYVTYGEARRMLEQCYKNGVSLSEFDVFKVE